MSGEVEVVKPNETIVNAAKRLADLNIGAMPICDGDAGELETGKPVTIGADDSLDEALRTMSEHQLRRLPVIDGHRLIGMISQADLAKALPKEKAGDLIEAISRDW